MLIAEYLLLGVGEAGALSAEPMIDDGASGKVHCVLCMSEYASESKSRVPAYRMVRDTKAHCLREASSRPLRITAQRWTRLRCDRGGGKLIAWSADTGGGAGKSK